MGGGKREDKGRMEEREARGKVGKSKKGRQEVSQDWKLYFSSCPHPPALGLALSRPNASYQANLNEGTINLKRQ